ncbi:MAG: hypothetical protein A2Y15_05495 [Clostridiales bacterium GWF2_36_10]|nr:MAG: hypothetical protein A2Y15_05495 [Clostridiales bacterium GWF2_36_10]
MANTQNIISGLSYTIETSVPIKYSYALRSLYSKNEDAADDKKLTDGVKASTVSFSDVTWHRAYRGYSRIVTFELPCEKAVTGFSISMLQSNSAGVYLSDKIKLSVSENGTEWMSCYTYDNSDELSSDQSRIVTSEMKNQTRYKAKYVKIEYMVYVNCYVDEIEIYGEDINGTEAAFVKDADIEYVNAFSAGVEGAQEMALLYCGYPGTYNISYVQNTVDQMIYYAGYVNKDGMITDTMFDSVLFCPFQQNGPSGNKIEKSKTAVSLMSDWLYYINNMFDKTYNVSALEVALNQVMNATGKTDCKMKIFTGVPFPNISSTPFGDINGDGKVEYCRNTEEQMAIIKWFMDEFISRFSVMGYKNVIPGGFYWVQESLDASNLPAEKDFVHAVSELCHERNVYFYWIPSLLGNGFDSASELGFDCAMMQPNYNFLTCEKDGKRILYADEKMFEEVNEVIKKYGLGVEIEIHWNALNSSGTSPAQDEAIRCYYTYLDAGYALGYINDAAHSYYQNSGPGTYYNCAVSKVNKLRAIYDDTYAFVKSTYVPHMVTLSSEDYETVVNNYVKGTIRKDSGSYAAAIGAVNLEVTVTPQYGSVELIDQRFVYKPNEGYEGSDSFTVVASNTYCKSEPLTVNINVIKNENVSDTINSENSLSSEPENKTNKGIIGSIIAGIMAVSTIITVVVFKRKKKKIIN